jgi:RHS repeat-associated protein
MSKPQHDKLRMLLLFLALALCCCGRAMASATATMTVNGSEHQISGSWDSGNVTITFSGYVETAHYAQFSTTASLASALAGMFSRDYIGQGLCAHASGATITFQLTNGGAFGALQITGPTTSFTFSPTGWTSSPTKADFGTVTLTVNGAPVAYTPYGLGSTPVTVAAGLAGHVMTGARVMVTATNDAIYVKSTTAGSSSNYTYSLTTTSYDSGQFSEPSFMTPPADGNLDGGADQNTDNGVTVYSYNNITYQSNGNVTGYADSVMGTWANIAYDNVNRVALAQQTGTPTDPYVKPVPFADYCWSYDAFGNRTMQEGSSEAFQSGSGGLSACTPQTGATTGTDWATYPTSGSVNNQVQQTNAPGIAATYLYDAAGDITYDGTNQYLYDAEGRICAVQSLTGFDGGPGPMTGYEYDADGARLAKGNISSWSCDPTVAGVSPAINETDYILGPGDEQVTELASDANGLMMWMHTNVWAGGQLLGTYDTNGLHFYLDDWLGTRRAQTDYAGVAEESCSSLPFGDSLNCSGLTSNYAYAGLLAFPTEHHFTGKERDTESGLDYFGARYYASTMGRWLSPDWSASPEAVPYSHLDNPQSLNLYGYVLNNPLSKPDLDGHGCPPDCEDPTAPTQVAPASGGVRDFLMLPVSGAIGMLKAGYNALLSGGSAANRRMGIPDTPALQPGNDGEKAGMTVAPLVMAAGMPEMAPEAAAMEAADVGTMASQLSKETGVTRVDLSTPEMRTNLDLVGKPHFDKVTGEYINTPHVQSRPISVGPNGKINLGPQTTRAATAADIQAAQKVLKKTP